MRGLHAGRAKRDAAAAAMAFVSETEALIVDIRRNGGGEPDAVAALSSYFFAEPVHLNDLYFRPDNSTHQYWTFPGVPGKRYTDREIYVLTSKRTGSAAEEFAYNLKQLKRAVIVGEVTLRILEKLTLAMKDPELKADLEMRRHELERK
jgi:retinol-binding protein 3